ncbi:MAG: hypothetical protein ACYSUM_13465 [Planctomycetota bacterium]|jgi:hypothetical protein
MAFVSELPFFDEVRRDSPDDAALPVLLGQVRLLLEQGRRGGEVLSGRAEGGAYREAAEAYRRAYERLKRARR